MTAYDIVFIFANALAVFATYKFMCAFFTKQLYSKKIEFLSYFTLYIIVLFIHFSFNIPIVITTTNVLGNLLITFNYKSDIFKKLLVVSTNLLISIVVEWSVIILTGYIHTSWIENVSYCSIIGLVASQIIIFIISLSLNKYKYIRKGESVPAFYWVCMIFIPVLTSYISIIIFSLGNPSQLQVILTMLAVLFINFLVFYLYDSIIFAFTDKMEKELLRRQNIYYENQVELMKISISNTRNLSHDLKNHLYTIASLIEKGNTHDVLRHISEMTEICNNRQYYSKSGNIIIDSVLNFKLQQAIEKNIEIKLNIEVPNEIELQSFDIAIILGNLIDNAINAVCKLPKGRFLNVKIKYDSGRMLIEISNPYNGEIKKEKENFITTHKDKSNHGIGISNVKLVVKKYNGDIKFIFNDNQFSVYIYMYVS